MGCFDSTCAFSRLAVHRGDPVLLVVLKKDRGTYELRQDLIRVRQWREELPQLKAPDVDRAWLFKHYPSLKDKTPEAVAEFIGFRIFDIEYNLNAEYPAETIAWGTYDDYGWIDELDRPEGQSDLPVLFVHREIAEKIALHMHANPEDPQAVFEALVTFADLTRTPLSPITLVGEQHHTMQELERQEFLLEISRARLEEMRRRLKACGLGGEE